MDGGLRTDAVVADLGVSRDAAPAADAAEPDAGPAADAAEPDTGLNPDAEPAPDAVEPDALPVDTGPADAEPAPDALEPPDAGPADAQDLDATAADAGCVIGQVTSTATTGQLNLFGTPVYFNNGSALPAGTYRIRYVDGCMKYGGGQGWTVNAYAANQSCWYLIGASTSDRIVVPPGTVGYAVGSGAFANFEDCVAASAAVPPVEFTVQAPTPMGIWLLDSPYSDNLPGIDNRNPTWQLDVVTATICH